MTITKHGPIEKSGPWKGCKNCCMDGDNVAPCLDVESCAAKGPENGKYAFVLSHWLPLTNTLALKNIEPMKKQAQKHGIDLLMLMLQDHIDRTPQSVREEMENHGFR